MSTINDAGQNSILNGNISTIGNLNTTVGFSNYPYFAPTMGNITISSNTLNPSTLTASNALEVTGDATFNGNISWKGKNLGEMMEKICDRLAILTPDLEKLEHFPALKKAYNNYKMLEALCEVPSKEKNDS